jgi:hypothetical protein
MAKVPNFQKWASRSSAGIGIVCLVVGIIGDALNSVPGLEPTHWFLLAIALLVLAAHLGNVALGMARLEQ